MTVERVAGDKPDVCVPWERAVVEQLKCDESFTITFDSEILALMNRIAEAERRSIGAVLQTAALEYAERRGEAPPSVVPSLRWPKTSRRRQVGNIPEARESLRSGPPNLR